MKTNFVLKVNLLVVLFTILLSGNVFSQFANWHLNTDSSIYFNSGNVGIGVQNPAYKLDVNGSVRISGSLNFQGWANINYGNGFGTQGPNGWNMIFDENGWLSVGEFAMTFSEWAPLTVTAYTTNTNNFVQPFARFAGFGMEDEVIRYFDIGIANPQNASYNQIVKENDFSISWKDDNENSQSPGLVIAPYFNSSTETTGGIRVDVSGRVGIGEKDPRSMLDISGDLTMHFRDIFLDTTSNNGIGWFGTTTKQFSSKSIGGTVVYGNNGGALGIKNGTTENIALRWMPDTANNALILIDGKVKAREVEIKVNVWADYVFAKDYKLMSLGQLEQYIKEHNKLPDLPTEAEAIEKGVNIGDMQTILLKKIEETTLYLIELKKENDELKKANEALLNRVEAIETKVK